MIGVFIGIIGVLLTIFIGIYSIRITKNNKAKKSLLFKKKECFSLFNSAINNLKIDVKYHNNKVENILILLKAEIENTGNTDIDKSSIFEPIKVTTSNDFKWLEIKHIDEVNSVKPRINKIDNKTISIDWDLLKKKEKIEFEALIEANKKEGLSENYMYSFDFLDSLKFNFRITDIDNIDIEDDLSKSLFYHKKRIKHKIFTYSTIILFGLIFFFTPYLSNYLPQLNDSIDLYFELANKNNDSLLVSRIYPSNVNTIMLKDLNNKTRIIKIDDFNKNYDLKSIKQLKYNNTKWLIWLLSSILIVLGVYLIIQKIIQLKVIINEEKSRNANKGS